jgi:hypothetical protein
MPTIVFRRNGLESLNLPQTHRNTQRKRCHIDFAATKAEIDAVLVKAETSVGRTGRQLKKKFSICHAIADFDVKELQGMQPRRMSTDTGITKLPFSTITNDPFDDSISLYEGQRL